VVVAVVAVAVAVVVVGQEQLVAAEGSAAMQMVVGKMQQ
jgi:hypothetical protein